MNVRRLKLTGVSPKGILHRTLLNGQKPRDLAHDARCALFAFALLAGDAIGII
jgi:hypothetical protein